jgi:hypothetical protein
MAMRVKDGVEPINRPTDMGRGGSRPKPPKAGARSASLEAPRPMSDHQTAKRRLTPKTVALDSAKGAALGTLHFSMGFQKPAPAKAGGRALSLQLHPIAWRGLGRRLAARDCSARTDQFVGHPQDYRFRPFDHAAPR